MPEVIDPVVVDGHEIPGFELHQRRCRAVNTHGVRQRLCETLEPLVLGLIDFHELRNERTDMLRIEFERVKSELLKILGHGWWVNRPRRHVPLLGIPTVRFRPRLADLGIE